MELTLNIDTKKINEITETFGQLEAVLTRLKSLGVSVEVNSDEKKFTEYLVKLVNECIISSEENSSNQLPST